jgi:hypothetical protein
MQLNKTKYIAAFLILLLMTILFFLNKNTNEEYHDDDSHNKLIVSAMAGDVSASRQLYINYHGKNRDEQALMWARNGAVNGADDLLLIYVDAYKKLPINIQESELRILKKNIQKEGAKKLISLLEK